MESTENGVAGAKPELAKPLPRCPYCGQDPMSMTIQQMHLGPYQILSIFCGNRECRKSLNVQLLQIVPEPGGLVIPGGPLADGGRKQ